ncbi:Glyoxylase, beta-lactamase superfamily II [Paenibacillus sp. UNC496MF]|uniref:MBL fold metallo-hydrolase n=1 Tax=Paenibacillus sp. UNC496MF TaxID=1502753 RepID=UPI0008E5E41E|nr:MBL fold metallo-hydrolase [Paenibacillus sp. UNC496MF]SFI93697.1 Glyoxylase, beta-lactamase superfamily II [Paenibacillus sp. UNC496MF]
MGGLAGRPAATLRPEGIVQVRVPLPFSLKWVNSYLLRDDRGYTLIDPGLHTAEAVASWEAVMAEHGVAFADIHTIVLTHQHPDHYGLAGWFQQRSGAPVRMSAEGCAYAERLWGADGGAAFKAELTALYARHGMPAEALATLGPHLDSFVAKVAPQPAVTFLEAGQTVRMGGETWLAIDAPGHAGGQLVFYAASRKWMLCGDQVLPTITPNVSVVPGEDDRQLERFLASLRELARYDVELAFPGHREPFDRFAERAAELAAHHERRLAEIVGLLREEPRTGYALCMRLFGERIAGDAHHLRFAMSETLAHVFHLEHGGRIGKRGGEGSYTYFA